MFRMLEGVAFQGPPPESLLGKRPIWMVLIAMFAGTLLLRLVSLDLVGVFLCSFAIFLAAAILRDGMRELPKYALPFALLCGINLLFYAVPVVYEVVDGRAERRIDPVESVRVGNTEHFTYTLTVRKSPFFCLAKGLLYNAQSTGALALPIAMLLGCYLGVSAHWEAQRYISSTYRLLPGPGQGSTADAAVTADASRPAGMGNDAAIGYGGTAAAALTSAAARTSVVEAFAWSGDDPTAPKNFSFHGAARKLGEGVRL